jgi:hypothetical protein
MPRFNYPLQDKQQDYQLTRSNLCILFILICAVFFISSTHATPPPLPIKNTPSDSIEGSPSNGNTYNTFGMIAQMIYPPFPNIGTQKERLNAVSTYSYLLAFTTLFQPEITYGKKLVGPCLALGSSAWSTSDELSEENNMPLKDIAKKLLYGTVPACLLTSIFPEYQGVVQISGMVWGFIAPGIISSLYPNKSEKAIKNH